MKTDILIGLFVVLSHLLFALYALYMAVCGFVFYGGIVFLSYTLFVILILNICK